MEIYIRTLGSQEWVGEPQMQYPKAIRTGVKTTDEPLWTNQPRRLEMIQVSYYKVKIPIYLI